MAQVRLVVDSRDAAFVAAVEELGGYLRRCGVDIVTSGSAQSHAVLVFADRPGDDAAEEALLAHAERGGAVLLAGPTVDAWRGSTRLLEAAGLGPGRRTPIHEIRVRPGPDGAEVAARFGGELLLTDRWVPAEKVADDVEVLLTAHLGLVEHPVMTLRRTVGVVGTCTLGAGPATVSDPRYRRLVHRWLRAALGLRDGPPIRVGLLGYGAIGAEHAAALRGVEGLELTAVADPNPDRLAAATGPGGQLATYEDGVSMLADAEIDLVVVSTPPNTHAEHARRVLESVRSVVVEKPLCLTVTEADELISLAADRGRALAVYQNRRWDADFVALERAVRSGLIGEVFHFESFVGGYGHPCNYWHSDEAVSGGAGYDWGSHYLDWILALLQAPIEHVTAAAHKRVWYDVTNSDHVRVTIRFVGGAEAEFVHSDLAAVAKPKWYVLGTRGALQGDWRVESVLARSPVGNLIEDRFAPAEAPARLRLFVPAPGGGVAETLLAIPLAAQFAFHRELADHLLAGSPLSVPAEFSRRTVAIMEAAMASARSGGQPIRPVVP